MYIKKIALVIVLIMTVGSASIQAMNNYKEDELRNTFYSIAIIKAAIAADGHNRDKAQNILQMAGISYGGEKGKRLENKEKKIEELRKNFNIADFVRIRDEAQAQAQRDLALANSYH